MNSKQSDFKIIEPKFIKGIESNHIAVSEIQDEDGFRDSCICDCSIESQSAAHVSFERVIFKNVEFKAVALDQLELTDTRFENCDLSNVAFNGAIIHRTEFINCKLVGLNLSDAALHNVYIEGCNGRFALISYARMKRVVFSNSVFENSNFQNSHFEKIQFSECNLRLSQMSGTSLSGIDLSSCDLEGLGIQPEDLRGAIVTPLQAVDFSKLLGLIVKE